MRLFNFVNTPPYYFNLTIQLTSAVPRLVAAVVGPSSYISPFTISPNFLVQYDKYRTYSSYPSSKKVTSNKIIDLFNDVYGFYYKFLFIIVIQEISNKSSKQSRSKKKLT